MSDEGFHEIQLNGKQLVFFFMAATVVAVVIFLCGVMVGRGVPTRAGSAIDVQEQADLDPTAVLRESPAAPAVASTGNAPVTAQETLIYPGLLDGPNPPAETLTPPIEPPAARVAPPPPARVTPSPTAAQPAAAETPVAAAAKPAAVTPPPAPVVAPPTAPPRRLLAETTVARGLAPSRDASAGRGQTSSNPVANTTLAEPPGTGFVVQVAAVRQRAEANTIASRLSTKGYPAFVTTAGANFRVRVGKYTDRREAESVAGRLEKEEKIKPWITR